MLLDDEGGGLAAGGHGEADRAVLGLDLDHERAQHIDAEALPALAIFGIAAIGVAIWSSIQWPSP